MMRILSRVCVIAVLLVCYVLLTWSLEHEQSEGEDQRRPSKKRESTTKTKQNNTAAAASVDDRKLKSGTVKKKLKKSGSRGVSRVWGGDVHCTKLGGICQPRRYICQGRYVEDKCTGAKTLQCCLSVGAWSILCAGHHNNRVRACDGYGCGAFNSRRGNKLHKAVDVVCDDYGLVNAPFSGSLAGPVTHMDPNGIQYDGVKLLTDVHCVKMLNIRPYRYMGPVTKGEALGYLLPLQDRFSGITSHLKLQMCDGTDPSPFI